MANTQTVQLWDYWFVLKKRKLMILMTLAVVLAIVGLVNALQKPVYSSTTDLIVEVSIPTKILGSQTASYQSSLDPAFFDTQARLINSSYFSGLLAEELAKNRSELPLRLRDAPKEALAGLSRAIITLPAKLAAMVINITVENQDPEVAAFLANAIAKVYIRYTQQSQLDSSRQMLVFLMQKLEEIRDKMKDSTYAISDIDIGEQLAAASKIYGQNHPVVVELKSRKKALEDIMRSAPENDALKNTPTAIPKEGGLQSDVTLPRDNFALSRSARINEELYQVLLKKLQELNLTSDVLNFNVRVVETARVPEQPVRPNKRLNLIIGVVMGLVMGVGLGFFREYLDTTIKTVEELKDGFNMTVLAMIPTMGGYKPKSLFSLIKERWFTKEAEAVKISKHEIQDEQQFLIHRLAGIEKIEAPIAEAYRTLRTNLQFAQLDRPLKTLLVTSSIRGEGKTTTSVNLAIVMAQAGKKVLLVDTDLRRPRLHKAFHSDREVGMTNLLMGEVNLEDVVRSTDVPNLHILPSGPLPPNPAELVASDRMKSIIQYMSSKYDLVLFDSPPLVAVTDAALLSADVDGLIMVVEAGALPRELFKQGLDRLSSVKPNILGCILNNVNLQKGSYYYYYYHYHHYDYETSKKT